MGFGIKSITNAVKKGAGNLITGTTGAALGAVQGGMKGGIKGAVRGGIGGAIIGSGLVGGGGGMLSGVSNRWKNGADPATQQAEIIEQKRAEAAKKSEFNAKMTGERNVNNAYVDSLGQMRRAATPAGVQGARFGDINRTGAAGAPWQNVGMIRRAALNTGRARPLQAMRNTPGQPQIPPRGPIGSGMHPPRNPTGGFGGMANRMRGLPGRPMPGGMMYAGGSRNFNEASGGQVFNQPAQGGQMYAGGSPTFNESTAAPGLRNQLEI